MGQWVAMSAGMTQRRNFFKVQVWGLRWWCRQRACPLVSACACPRFINHSSMMTASWLQVWAPGDRCFVGPPTLVPKAGGTAEDDVWVLAMIHDAGGKNFLLPRTSCRLPLLICLCGPTWHWGS